MPRKESKFQTIFKRSFNLYCSKSGILGHYRKIIDAGYINPYDCYTVTEHGFIAFELKVNRLKTKFNFKALFGNGNQYHEIVNLKRVRATNHLSWVLIEHREKQGQKYKVYAVTPDNADKYYKMYNGVKLKDMEYIELERINNPTTRELLYDLTPLMK